MRQNLRHIRIFFAVILRDELPYVNLKSDVAVLKAIYRGDLPTNREAASALHPTWKLCWAQDPKRRPNMSTILESVRESPVPTTKRLTNDIVIYNSSSLGELLCRIRSLLSGTI